MKFESFSRETVIVDPSKEMARKVIPSEIRLDPLRQAEDVGQDVGRLDLHVRFQQTSCHDLPPDAEVAQDPDLAGRGPEAAGIRD